MEIANYSAIKSWVFQGDRSTYRLYDSLCDGLKNSRWLVSHYSNEIRAGHMAIIWKAGVKSGIYAIGRITSNPQIMPDLPESLPYWVNQSEGNKPANRVEIQYLHTFKLINALKRSELEEIPHLNDLQIIKQAQGTNFKVTDLQWQTLVNLFKERYGLDI